MLYIFLGFFLLWSNTVHAEWNTPKHPDPQTILHEAQKDTENQRYEVALQKFVWFHNNALRYKKSLYGVRLSFALSSWMKLTEVYPSALVKLKEIRDHADHNVKNGMNPYSFFHDFRSINEKLGEAVQTVELFKWLDTNQPQVAKEVYRLAQPALIDSKEYTLSGKYLDASIEYKHISKIFRWQKAFEKEENNPMLNGLAEKHFSHQISNLVALLAINNRNEEAELIIEQAKKEWEDDEFWLALQVALQGQFPEP